MARFPIYNILKIDFDRELGLYRLVINIEEESIHVWEFETFQECLDQITFEYAKYETTNDPDNILKLEGVHQ